MVAPMAGKVIRSAVTFAFARNEHSTIRFIASNTRPVAYSKSLATIVASSLASKCREGNLDLAAVARPSHVDLHPDGGAAGHYGVFSK